MTLPIRCAAAMLAVVCFAFPQETPPAPPAPPAAPSEAAPPPAVPALTGRALRLSVALGLSAEQGAQVQKILDNEAGQLQPLLSQLRQNREDITTLAQGGATGEAFDTRLQTLAGAQGSLVSHVAVIRARTLAQIWALLTPAQRAKAAQLPGLLNPEEAGMGMRGRPPRNRPMRPYRPAP